jgi:hypothetical protein
VIDVNTSQTPEEGAHNLSWLNGLIIIIIIIIVMGGYLQQPSMLDVLWRVCLLHQHVSCGLLLV